MIKLLPSLILIFSLSFLSQNSSARGMCGDIKDKSILGLEEVVQTSILDRPECRSLKTLWENRSELLSQVETKTTASIVKQSEKFQKYFIRCQEELHKSCYGSSKPIDESELTKLFSEFKKDPLLNMSEPQGLCTQRALVLSQKLANQGYDVEMALFESSTILGLVKDDKNKPVEFRQYDSLRYNLLTGTTSDILNNNLGFHYVVSVKVKLPNGKIEKRILDPQFADKPLSLNNYSEQLTGSECVENPSRSTQCRVKFKKPVSFNYLELKDYIEFLNGNLEISDPCGWNLVKPSVYEIKEANRSRPPAMLNAGPIDESDRSLSPEEISLKYNVQYLREKVRILEGLPSSSFSKKELRMLTQQIEDLKYEIKIRLYRPEGEYSQVGK